MFYDVVLISAFFSSIFSPSSAWDSSSELRLMILSKMLYVTSRERKERRINNEIMQDVHFTYDER